MSIPEETNRYIRINRKSLLSDSNMVKKGSITEDIISPIQTPSGAFLLSRTGDNRKPVPGYCLHFDNNNPDAYIQTEIPYSDRDLYNIVIKGEGTNDILYVSNIDDTIVIKQKPLELDDYFDLSYIAFVRKDNKSLAHLYECEEGEGIILYDAVGESNAELEEVININKFRATTKSKEWIDFSKSFNIYNLTKDIVDLNTVSMGTLIPTDLTKSFSYCITVDKCTMETFNSANEGDGFIYNALDDSQYGFAFKKHGSKIGFYGPDIPNDEDFTFITDIEPTLIFNNKENKIIITSDRTITKVFINDIDNPIISHISGYPDSLSEFGLRFNHLQNISNIKGFSFDISGSTASYTLQDYINDKDVDDSYIDGVLLNLKNIVPDNLLWLDASNNNNIGTINNTATFPNKEYGTWCNAVGYTEPDYNSLARNINSGRKPRKVIA